MRVCGPIVAVMLGGEASIAPALLQEHSMNHHKHVRRKIATFLASVCASTVLHHTESKDVVAIGEPNSFPQNALHILSWKHMMNLLIRRVSGSMSSSHIS